ncbi:hypothetical protein [Microbaculum marinum]|uniref:Uncharacterized protein n=1 Tax=Microbaculum marinum TaxID=1764581 RepID=A0AAW9RUQ7_9HYPH
MSVASHTSTSRRRAGPLALAGLALTGLLAAPPGAAAGGLTSEEVLRKPVAYSGHSNCSGSQHTCYVSLGQTPNKKKKRLEIAGLSCQARIFAGDAYRFSFQGGVTLQEYEHLQPVHAGTNAAVDYYVARSEMRYFAPVGDEMRVYVNGTEDIAQLSCILQGTLVTYQ